MAKRTSKTESGRLPNDPLAWVDGEAHQTFESNPLGAATIDEGEHPMAAGGEVNSQTNAAAMAALKRVVAALREGHLSERVDIEAFDGDWADVFGDVNGVIEQWCRLMADMGYMSSEHERGDIEVVMDVTRYSGDYARMAKGINDMVAGHITVKKKAMACVEQFGQGNFEAHLERFPGKKAFINDTIETLRANLKALIAELQRLIAASSVGQLNERAKVGHLQGDFAGLVNGINAMLDEILIPIGEGNRVLDQIANGKIDELIAKTYQGDHERMKQNVNNIALMLQKFQAEFAQLTEYSRQGQLNRRGNVAAFSGAYADIIKGANDMLDAILVPIAEGNRVLRLIRGGNLRERVEIECQGDHQSMKDAINGVHGWLTQLVAFVTRLANGDMTAQMSKASDQDQIHEWLMLLKGNINALVADANRLSVAAVEGKLATRADASKHQGDFRKIVQGVNDTLDAVIGPLNVAANYVDRIAKGDIPDKISDSYNGDFNTIKNNLNTCIDAVNALVADANRLSVAAVEGKLATRADAAKHQGDFRKIVQGVNDTLDAVIGPLNVAANYVDRIAKGDIPDKISDSYNGDFNTIKNNLNTCIDAVNALVADANLLSVAAVEGKLATRADAAKHQGDFRKIVQGVNDTLNAVIGPLNVAANYVDRISKGDIPSKITDNYNGDFNTIKNNLNTCVDAVNALVADANRLSVAAVEGKLATRADASKHQGDFRKIVQGVNDTLDAVIGPLNVAANYVDRISKGDIPTPITDSYNGDFNTIKNNLNTCINAVNALVADANRLSVAAVEGKLATRADAAKHQGDFCKIVQGVNDTLDAVIGPLNVAANYVDRISKGDIPTPITDSYNGDFNTIKNNLNTCINAVNALVADANMLSKAAVEGKLATRADATKHQGDFRKIVQGVNDTLDAVIGPLNVAANYVDRIAKGDIPAKIIDNYNGDFNTIKNNLNTCIDALNAIVTDAATLSQAIVDGDLNRQTDASKYQGDYRKVIEAFEKAFVGLNNTFYQIVDAVEQVGQAAEHLNVASQNMASTSEEQSSAVEEVTSSLEETDSQVKANTDAANTANQLVMGTSQAANAGHSKMEEMSRAMSDINGSAQNIAKIIKVIDEIAFQTNLLALNAAVEAARAGQHGRGFAVVAQEVRNLAGRSAKAARETAELIESSVKQVATGVGIAKETSEALNQIVTNVVKVRDLVGEIAAASVEQSRGVSQINAAMSQVAKAAQEGSQQSEELASSSSELANLAGRMRDEVRHFRLRERKAAAGAAALGLEGLTPELLAQLKALLAAQSHPAAPPASRSSTTGAGRRSPKSILPLDHDERGFGNF